MKSNTRRKFIKKASVLPIGLTLGNTPLEHTYSSQDNLPLASSTSKIKLSLNAWSYNIPLFNYIKGNAGGMSLFELLEECARLDFDAVDPTGYFFPGYPEVPKTSFINDFKRRAFQLGLDISGTGIRTDFATAHKKRRMADVELTKQWIEVAARMGAPVIRVFAGHQPEEHTWEEAAVWVSDALAECAEHGKQYGVLVGVQNHGGMLTNADEILKILSMAQSDWLGSIVDTGFFMSPNPYADIERVIPHAVNWQVKDLLQDRKGGEIDLSKLVNIIRASNYRGYLPIETLPIPGREDEYDAYKRVPILLANLRKALA
ncbi:Sugar phosphate isomerase/epimerase [Zobellia roscoffensis]|uniref:sugar phosphate isomerase/epimerase family protein n=1 Tax=Zobellia roscoffensis TaxID=2779508 RepID=UPI00188CD85A|nr:sugar phosphate isomerase/epimerase family protein [Zobellia roscoffensis]